MGLNQLFNKDLVFCLHAKDQTDLFEQVASLLEGYGLIQTNNDHILSEIMDNICMRDRHIW